jgi:DNA repair protein RadD
VRIRAGDFAVDDLRERMGGVVIASAVSEYKLRCSGLPAVAFCVDIGHSRAVAAAFRAAGVNAQHVDGNTAPAERRAAIRGLGDGGVKVLCNCGIVSEGLDVRAIGAAMLLRPTASLALHLQMIGRALRPSPNKDRAIILDFAGNGARHGFPDEPRDWSLDATPRRLRFRENDGPRARICPTCRILNAPKALICEACGADIRTQREHEEAVIRLREAERERVEEQVRQMTKFERIRWAGADPHRLRLVARINGYREGWAYYRLQELQGRRP